MVYFCVHQDLDFVWEDRNFGDALGGAMHWVVLDGIKSN
jgi:hypothetical protein